MNNIQISVENPELQYQLSGLLKNKFKLVTGIKESDINNPDIDLLLIDSTNLGRFAHFIPKKKEKEFPLFFPVVLIIPQSESDQYFQYVGVSLDEMIFTPLVDPLLSRTIENLLQTRQLTIELKHKNKQIRTESEEQITRIVNSAKIGLWDWDLTTDKVFFSSEWKKQIGYEADEFGDDLGEWQNRVHPDDLKPALKKINACIKSKLPSLQAEYRFRHKNGQYRWILAQGSLISDNSGKPVRISGSHIDITDRKLAEETIKERNRFIETILENAPIGFAVNKIKDGKPTFVSARFEKIYGVPQGSLISIDTFFDIVYKDTAFREVMRSRVLTDMESGDPDRMKWEDIPIKDSEGRIKYITAMNIPIPEQGIMVSTVQDVTARIKAESEQKRFLKILESSLNEIYTFDSVTLKFNYANKGALKNLGYSLHELQEMTAVEIKPEFSEKSFLSFINKLKGKPEEILVFQTTHKRKNGSEYPVEVHMQLIPYDEEKTFVSIVADITDRKLAKDAIISSQKELSMIYNSVSDIIYLLSVGKNNEYCFSSVNGAFLRATGLKKNKVIGKKVQEVIPHSSIKSALNNYGKAIKNKKPVTWEEESNYPAGKRTGIVTVSPVFNEKGICINLVGAVHDITEIREKEDALRESEQKYRLMADYSGDVISVHDMNMKYIFISPAVKTLRGFKPEEVLNQNLKDALTPDSYRIAMKIINEELAHIVETGGGPKHSRLLELEIIRKDGTTVWVEVKVSLMTDENNKPAGIISVTRDISQRKEAESELIKAKEKAEESDRLKTVFLANMSHEIRTPMNGILGFTQILRETGVDDPRRDYYIDVINNSCDRLLSVVNDIMDISKIESGIIDIHMEEVNVNQLMQDVYTRMKDSLKTKNLSFDNQFELPDDKAFIKTDKSKLLQIITNIVGNAIKFTHEGGIKVSYKIKKFQIEFVVEDTGIGIDNTEQEFVFDRFRQADERYSRKYEGAGLGLPIAKAFIEKLGGKIWVESQKDKGTAMHFNIPYVPVEKTTDKFQASEDEEIFNWSGRSVLIAEDDKSNYEFIAEVLEPTGIKIYGARNGKEALDVYEKSRPDIILMDILMPEIDGYTVTRKIRKTDRSTPIIAITAYAQDSDRVKSLEAGCNDHISKPVYYDMLLKKLWSYLK